MQNRKQHAWQQHERPLGEPDSVYRDVLNQWNEGWDRGEFPHLGTDSHWAFARARLSAFRSAEEWLTAFEMLVYYNGLGDFQIIITAFGNRLCKQGFQDPARNGLPTHRPLASGFAEYVKGMVAGKKRRPEPHRENAVSLERLGLHVPSTEVDWCPDPLSFDVILNGNQQHFALTEADYAGAHIALDAALSGDVCLDRRIAVLRVLAHRLTAEDIFFPPAVLLEYVGRPSSLPLLLQVDDWCNPGIGEIAKPSDSPCLCSLAQALAHNQSAFYECPAHLLNTHWSLWPQFAG